MVDFRLKLLEKFYFISHLQCNMGPNVCIHVYIVLQHYYGFPLELVSGGKLIGLFYSPIRNICNNTLLYRHSLNPAAH